MNNLKRNQDFVEEINRKKQKLSIEEEQLICDDMNLIIKDQNHVDDLEEMKMEPDWCTQVEPDLDMGNEIFILKMGFEPSHISVYFSNMFFSDFIG